MSRSRCQFRRQDGTQCFREAHRDDDHTFPDPTVEQLRSPMDAIEQLPPLECTVTTIGNADASLSPIEVEILPWTTCLTPKNWGSYDENGRYRRGGSIEPNPGWYASVGLDLEPKLSASGEGVTERDAAHDALQKILPRLREIDESSLTEQQRANRRRMIDCIEAHLGSINYVHGEDST